jgi:hypothetical protein
VNREDVVRLLVDPFMAVSIDPEIAQRCQPTVSKELWVRANVRLVDELGVEAWLTQLLDVLEAGGSERNDADLAGFFLLDD